MDQGRKPRSLRTILYWGLVGISLASAVTIYALRLYVEARLSEQSEAQVRAISRHRAQQALQLALLDGEIGLRGYLVTGDSRLLGSYHRSPQAEADAIRNTLDNLDPADQELAEAPIARIQAMVRAWHQDVADPLVRRRGLGSIPDLKKTLEKERESFEAIRGASDSLLRLLDGRDNARLVQVEASLQTARTLSIMAMAMVFLLGLWVSRKILRRVADPLVELADAARLGSGFPEPESIRSVREVEVLSRALFDLDVRIRDRERALRLDQEEAQAVRDFTDLVQRIDREEDLLAALEQALRRNLEADVVRVLLRAAEGEGLESRIPSLVPEETDRHRILGNAMLCRAMQKGGAVQLEALAPTACICSLGVPAKGAYLCIPLVASGQVMGLVNLQAKRSGHFTPRLQRIAEACISVAASALQYLRALDLAQEQAIRDGLTGTLNRRFLDEVLLKEADQALRRKDALSALMLDIDHFKRFNDTYGHEAGDEVLRVFARCLREHVRTGDVVARYGGEEFSVLLPHTDHDEAVALAERLRQRVEALPLPEPEFPAGCRVTVSIGVATLPDHASDAEGLLGAADRALYGAKGGGRNRVVGAGDIPR